MVELIRNIFYTLVHIVLVLPHILLHCDATTPTPISTRAFFSANQTSSLTLPSAVIRFRNRIVVSFRTCTSGQLLYQEGGGGNNSFKLAISETGSLDLTVSHNSDKHNISISSGLADNEWYTVDSSFLNGEIYLNIERGARLVSRTLISNSTYNQFLWDLDLSGGSGLMVGIQFTGCIQAGASVPLGDPNRQDVNVQWDSCPLEDDLNYAGCTAVTPDPCWKYPCKNGGTCNSHGTSYNCTCPKTYTGSMCEVDVGGEACKYTPCENGGTCEQLPGGSTRTYRCSCVPGFTGIHCEININECISHPCKNGARCVDMVAGYVCDCANTGYQGESCTENIIECLSNPCTNGATCSDTPGSYKCECPVGYGGENCSLVIDECASSPCRYGGTCTDDVGLYKCACATGFTGSNCEVNIDDCVGVTCGIPNTQCVDGVNAFTCRCKPGFTDPSNSPDNSSECLDVNECASDPCINNGTCINEENAFSCNCAPGYTGPTCEVDINECLTNPCINALSCIDEVNRFICKCIPGYTDPVCGTNIDDCLGNPCGQNGQCIDEVDTYNCSCSNGYTGTYCEVAINECQSGPCQNEGICMDGLAMYTCDCKPGFTGINCETNINDCVVNPCEHGGMCVDEVNKYKCDCTPEYMGQNCTRGYNACDPIFQPCKNGATCVTSPPTHNYTCLCADGFTGEDCDMNIDDCVAGACPSFQRCVDGINTYSCQCPIGFTGSDCSVDIDECFSGPCKNGATCVNLQGKYECQCQTKNISLVQYSKDDRSVYQVGYKGVNCEANIDECLYQPPVCQNNGVCRDQPGTFDCLCPGDSYASGKYCEVKIPYCTIVDEMFKVKNDSPVCHNNGVCNSLPQSYTCTCLPGFTGPRCKVNIDECASNPCMSGGTCLDLVNGYTCTCLDGITGSNCETDINECSSQPCQHSGQCMDQINRYTCNCTDTGFKGTYCEIDIDECESSPCVNDATCQNLLKDYTCNCHAGYTSKNCEVDIDECASTPCLNNATCTQKSDKTRPAFSYATAEGYICGCLPGYRGVNCETDIDECASNPCMYGTCMDKVNQYQCLCQPGYHGTNCDTEINECTTYTPCKNGATCIDKIADYTCSCAAPNAASQIFGGKNCSVELVACRSNGCQNNAICEPFLIGEVTHEYNCKCQFGSFGRYCGKKTTATYERGSWLFYENTSGSTDLEVSLRFRTTLPNGVIAVNLANLNSKYLLLSLRDGNVLQLIYNNQHVSYILELSTNSSLMLNDGQWQTVQFSVMFSGIEFNLTHADCIGDGNKCAKSVPFENSSVMHTLSTTYFSYKAADASRVTSALFSSVPGFVGCMEDVVVNSEWIIPLDFSDKKLAEVKFGCPRKDPCAPDPCNGNGMCNDLWYEFTCTCNRPYRGAVCNQTFSPGTFGSERNGGNQSIASFIIPTNEREAMKKSIDFSLFIRTREYSGLIFYIGGDNSEPVEGQTYIATELKDGYIQASVYLNQVIATHTVTDIQVNDGNLHYFQLKFDSQTNILTLVVDSITKTVAVTATYPLYAKYIFMGSLPSSSSPSGRKKRQAPAANINYSAPSFKGTMQDLRVNGKLLEFYPITDPDPTLPPPMVEPTLKNVEQGEVSDNVCAPLMPCQNNGTCTDQFFNDYTCSCVGGYKGKNCTELDFCMYTTCPGGSTCIDLIDGFECVTPATFNGVTDYVQYRPALSNATRLSLVSLKLRTRDDVGVIMHIQGTSPAFTAGINQYLTLEMTDTTTLSLTMDLGNAKSPTVLSNIQIRDGNWHDVKVEISSTAVTLSFDQHSNTSNHAISDANLKNLVTDASNIYIGGLPAGYISQYTESASITYFKGCIDQPRIGQMLLPFFLPGDFINQTTASRLNVVALTTVKTGCTGDAVCDPTPCQNSATCKDIWNDYQCECVYGFDGKDCEYNIDDCKNHDCLNNGMCVDGIALYTCKCHPGYTGIKCEKDINECENVTCENNGTCIDGNNTFTCNCTEGFVGTTCSIEVGENCANTPCLNNATCVNVTLTYPDYGEVLTYNCSCLPGYRGYNCETEIDFCDGNPCHNAATCVSITQQEMYVCNCANGYTGTNCEIDIDECGVGPCQNGGTCTDQIGDYNCTCQSGWTGKSCEVDIDECTDAEAQNQTLCDNGGVCVNEGGSYSCNCIDTGYKDDNCSTEIDECIEIPGICRSGGTCTNTEGSFECNCTLGYSGTTCEGARCLTLCENGGTCKVETKTDGRGSYETWECQCVPYYEGDQCEVKGPCVDAPCQNDATCSQSGDNYTCECVSGWEGTNCDLDKDECITSPCQNGATCNNHPGTYNCTCDAGYTGVHCGVDINECLSNPCQNGVCSDLKAKYECDCTGTGYMGTNCAMDINECLVGTSCQNGATCLNQQPFYNCTCVPGYIGDTCHSPNPCNDTNYCSNNGNCSVEVDNVFENATATCACIDNWLPPRCMESKESDDDTIAIIVGSIFGVIALIILIAVLVVMLKRVKEKRATRGTYSPSRQEMSGSRMDMGNSLKVPPPERLI